MSSMSLLRFGLRRVIFIGLGAILTLLLSLSAAPTTAAPTSQTPPPSTSTPLKPILLTDPVPDPKQDGVMWFPATGHTLRGAFLSYWQQYGGLAQFGYPLTEEFFEPVGPDNKPVQVQYFERNRFEHHPENQPPYDVLLGTLGRDFHPQDPPAAQLPAPALYFPETGHNLSGAFKEYWQTHGGLFVHGFPITEAAMEKSTDGREYLVQWFERSRFELHPENAGSPYEVLLGLLGRQLSEKKGYPYGWYPQNGHAADFSWISGLPQLPQQSCNEPICSCTFQSVPRVEPFGDGIEQSARAGLLNNGDYVVLFGRFASQNEQPPRRCPAPAYLVRQAQSNPVKLSSFER